MKKIKETNNWIILADGKAHAEAVFKGKAINVRIVAMANVTNFDCAVFLEALLRGELVWP